MRIPESSVQAHLGRNSPNRKQGGIISGQESCRQGKQKLAKMAPFTFAWCPQCYWRATGFLCATSTHLFTYPDLLANVSSPPFFLLTTCTLIHLLRGHQCSGHRCSLGPCVLACNWMPDPKSQGCLILNGQNAIEGCQKSHQHRANGSVCVWSTLGLWDPCLFSINTLRTCLL